ncbi:hypothetical protein BDV23DRAFT_193968 [Aspergillus alliaceus]|uniref:Uncharacterized protein n=1 Tax=Petromyces alliaceus TaxID=209559 RepID=A0A5N7C7F7_PETAA|nr:hypothetical protein BDV23DRAFT_193968 [Aspergillus alliaceus]
MGLRGLWNLHIHEKWYRSCHPRGRTSPPEDKFTLQTIKKGAFLFSRWSVFDGFLAPTTIQVDLARIVELATLYSFGDGTNESNGEPLVSGILDIDFGMPTPMSRATGAILHRLHATDSPVFKMFSRAFLRLASWDFEVSYDSNVELPIIFASVPSWTCPRPDIYWFHRAPGSLTRHRTRVSVFLTNYSATQCSPGFRALARVLASYCWKKSQTHRETRNHSIPTKILKQCLHISEPQDAVALSQASFVAGHCYYATIPQIKDLVIRDFDSSIPCCGKREEGLCCSECCSWQHIECICTSSQVQSLRTRGRDHYLFARCREGTTCTVLDPGRINRTSSRKIRQGYRVTVGCLEKVFHLRLSKPARL